MTVRPTLLAFLLLACGFAAGLTFVGRMRAEEQALAQTPVRTPAAPRPVSAPPAVPGAPAALPDFSLVAQRTVASVVNVSSQQVVRRMNDPFEVLRGRDPFGSSVENSLGSGVIVSADGYILTNNHVVTGDGRASSLRAVDITVTLSDKRDLPAKVVGVDEGTDLALLKVAATGLPVMPWGDSDRLKVAEWVLAIGNPYQLSETVTLGIVSAVNRKNVGINMYENFIQTDAAINPGNSGGALISANGELIGINTAIFSQSGGYQGIGFAVASNLARQVMKDLQTYGEVRRGTISTMRLRPVTTYWAQRLGTDNTQGVLVAQILESSPADRAGFEPGDIIVSFNGTEITEGRQFLRMVGESPIGSSARVGVFRGGKRIELKVPIEQERSSQR